MPLKGPGLDTQKCVLVGSTHGEVQNPGEELRDLENGSGTKKACGQVRPCQDLTAVPS